MFLGLPPRGLLLRSMRRRQDIIVIRERETSNSLLFYLFPRRHFPHAHSNEGGEKSPIPPFSLSMLTTIAGRGCIFCPGLFFCLSGGGGGPHPTNLVSRHSHVYSRRRGRGNGRKELFALAPHSIFPHAARYLFLFTPPMDSPRSE